MIKYDILSLVIQMNKFTFLDEKQILGDNRLEIFNQVNSKAVVTDFAILSGAYVSNYHKNDFDRSLINRTGYYWVNDSIDKSAYTIDGFGNKSIQRKSNRAIASRPVILASNIMNGGKIINNESNIVKIQYGFYPQKALDTLCQKELEKAYKRDFSRFELTKDTYTLDAREWYEVNKDFYPNVISVYKYHGKRYARVIANSCFSDEYFQLSNKKYYKNYDAVWVEVEPVNWLVDKETGIAISEKLLFGGIPFDYSKFFMNEYFAKELTQQMTDSYTKTTSYIKKLKK